MTNPLMKAIATPPGQPTQYVAMTTQEISAIQATWNAPPVLSLQDKLLALFDSMTPAQQASFSTVRTAVKNELSEGRNNIAQLVIQNTAVTSDLQPLKDQLLALFN